MPPQATDNYYVAQKAKLLRNFKKNARAMLEVSEPTYARDFTDRVVHEALEEYEELIPQIPYIGGRKNRLTGNLIGTGGVIAIYKVLRRYGKPDDQIGELVWRGWEGMSERYPQFLLRLCGRFQLSGFGQRMAKKMAVETQKREYAENSVAVYVEGDGVDFDFGIDFLECAIVEFYEAQGAAELAPYLCLFDFAMSKTCGLRLRRTMRMLSSVKSATSDMEKGGKPLMAGRQGSLSRTLNTVRVIGG
jgi:hypothetical protein